MLARHRAADALPVEPDLAAKAAARIERLERDAAELRGWLAARPEDRRGPTGAIRKRNRTDGASARMATGKGVIQGYTGVAAVDSAHQVIVEAQAHGTGADQELLVPVADAITPLVGPASLPTADAGYRSEANLQALAGLAAEAHEWGRHFQVNTVRRRVVLSTVFVGRQLLTSPRSPLPCRELRRGLARLPALVAHYATTP